MMFESLQRDHSLQLEKVKQLSGNEDGADVEAGDLATGPRRYKPILSTGPRQSNRKLPAINSKVTFSFDDDQLDSSRYRSRPTLPPLTSPTKMTKTKRRKANAENYAMNIQQCTFHDKSNRESVASARDIMKTWEQKAKLAAIPVHDDDNKVNEKPSTPKTANSLNTVLDQVPANFKRWKKHYTKLWVHKGADNSFKFYNEGGQN